MAIQEVTLKASAGTSITRAWERVKESLTAKTVLAASYTSAVNTFNVGSDPWDAEIFGMFNDDPSWSDFPRWRKENRHRTD